MKASHEIQYKCSLPVLSNHQMLSRLRGGGGGLRGLLREFWLILFLGHMAVHVL